MERVSGGDGLRGVDRSGARKGLLHYSMASEMLWPGKYVLHSARHEKPSVDHFIVVQNDAGCLLTGADTTWPYLSLPVDPKECIMLRDAELAREKNERSLENVKINDLRRNSDAPTDITHLMHNRCWTLLTKVIHPDTITKYLYLLLESIRRSSGWISRHLEATDNKYDDEID
ncbi:hypothetical protein BDW69DRAFT_23446 [Aspergillus filifer]